MPKPRWNQKGVFFIIFALIGSLSLLFFHSELQLLLEAGAREQQSLFFQQTQGQQESTQEDGTPPASPLPDLGNGRDLTLLLHPEDHIFREPSVQHFHWEITTGRRAPDGVEKEVFLINENFPGPIIEARSGDTLVVEIYNLLDEDHGIAIHWHGLRMRDANLMDGALGFTQCAISPGRNFTYTFTIDEDQHGTFWYHAHSETDRVDGLYGGLIVHQPTSENGRSQITEYGYDEELLLMVGDWYHPPAKDVLAKYMNARSNALEPVPDSLLINGLGSFLCSMAVPAHPVNCLDTEKPALILRQNKAYRLRVINVGAMAGVILSITQAQLKVIELDGGQQVVNDEVLDSIGILYPAERMDILVSWNMPDQDDQIVSYLTIELDKELLRATNLALTPVQSFPIKNSAFLPSSSSPQTQSPAQPKAYFNLSNALAPALPTPLSKPIFPSQGGDPHSTILLYTTIVLLSHKLNIPHGILNRTIFTPQTTSASDSTPEENSLYPPLPLLSLPRSKWNPQTQLIPWTGPSPQYITLIINNLDEHSHPFHLHGHSFYVLSLHRATFGWGSWNPYQSPEPPEPPDGAGALNLVNPLRKDTVSVPRRGYAVLMFLADNPGVWALHCHVLWHLEAGMGMGLQVLGSEETAFSESWGREAKGLCSKGTLDDVVM